MAKKLEGKTVAFVGKFGYGGRDGDALKALVAAEGGAVVDGEKIVPDYLVAGAGVGGNPPAAIAKIQKKHPQVQPIDTADFYQLIVPSAAEFLAAMVSVPQHDEYWNDMRERRDRAGTSLDLRGADFRNQAVSGIFYKVCLDGCDFSGAKISAYFDKVTGANFDSATMRNGSFTNAEDCSLRKVKMEDVRWNPAEFIRCDFSEARLEIRTGSYTLATDCRFVNTDLSGADLEHSKFSGADFSGAILTGAKLMKCNFTGARLAGAQLAQADLTDAILVNADLTGADLTGALLVGVDLAGATIDAADFTGATVSGLQLGQLDPGKAKGLDVSGIATGGQAGPNITELEKVAAQTRRLETSALIERPEGNVTFGLTAHQNGRYISTVVEQPGLAAHGYAKSLAAGMLDVTRKFPQGQLKADAIRIKCEKGPLPAKALQALAIAAWAEALGVAAPSLAEVQETLQKKKTAKTTLREELLELLRQGPAGIQQWNARQEEAAQVGKFSRVDLAGADLRGAIFPQLDMEAGNFHGANLAGAVIRTTDYRRRCNLKRADFHDADLSQADIRGINFFSANLAGANLSQAHLNGSEMRNASLRCANLAGADLSCVNLRGADLTDTNLAEAADLMRAEYDESTQFPAGFTPLESMCWCGKKIAPSLRKVLDAPAAPLDFPAFAQRLEATTNAAKFAKALSMLKTDRFKLFVEVKEDAITGVVKSQTDAELVYSCRLASDGVYGCCTQNLNICGGLRGSLCKHLIVLILGITKAGELDATQIDAWIQASRQHKPELNKDQMSETFLRYKGAEAGEVDWRPTETIPEDYYAL